MKILVVGGSGLIGGHAAVHLSSLGNQVTVASRNAPAAETPMASLPFLQGDYTTGGFETSDLSTFDALVFAAGQDPRHLQKGDDAGAHWQHANIEGIPKFFFRARKSGIKRVINIGSFYPQAMPGLVARNDYVRSRFLVDQAVRELATPDFAVVCLNPPYVLGALPGLKARSFDRVTQYAEGLLPTIPIFAPPGGVNFMSTQSLSEAIEGALLRGRSGQSYLIGDENLSFHDYFSAFFRAAGRTEEVPLLDREHPLIGSFAGLGGTIYFDTDPRVAKLLGYRRRDIQRAIEEIVALYGSKVQ